MKLKKEFSFKDIWSAAYDGTNLAEGLEQSDITAIAGAVIDRKEKDADSMTDWLDIAERGQKIINSQYEPKLKPFENAYSFQYPLLLNAVLSVSSRLFTEIHREKYLVHPKVIGADPQGAKAVSSNNVKHYFQELLIECDGSSWLDNMNKMYPKLCLMGTQIKQIVFDPATMYFDNSFIPYTDIFIHNKSENLEKAPAITKHVYLSQNEIIERIRDGLFIEDTQQKLINDGSSLFSTSDSDDRLDEDGNTVPHNKSYCILEQHCWLDLDNDGYSEPYIAFVNADSAHLYRLVPRINTNLSRIDEKFRYPIKLVPQQYFVDFHYMPDAEGNFWSFGLAKMIAPVNCIVNELLNNMANVAYIASQQGGYQAFGGRNAQDEIRVDMTKRKFVATSPGDLAKSFVGFDIRDPSPVIQQITEMMIATGEKMGALNESLSGEMPSRELPAQTMLMIVEQSLKNAQAIYRRIHTALTKEIRIVARMLREVNNQEHYQLVLDNPQANLLVDLNLDNLDLSMNSDASSSSSTERLMKGTVIKEMLQDPVLASRINVEKYLIDTFKSLDYPDPEQMIVPPPPPQDPPEVTIAREQIQADVQKNQMAHIRELTKLAIEKNVSISEIVKNEADAAAKLSGATANTMNSIAKLIQATEKEVEQDTGTVSG